MKSKIMVIGLDGATFGLIEPWVREGKLPNIARLMNEGSYGLLKSTIPPLSPQAWASFLTGKKPGKHGVFGFIKKRTEEDIWELVNSNDIGTVTLWDILTAYGVHSEFFFVPMTYPARPLKGAMISGVGALSLSSNFIYPPELKPKLIKKHGKKLLVLRPKTKSKKAYLSEMLKNIEDQALIMYDLIIQGKPTFACAVFTQVDTIQHFFWKQMDANFPNHNPKEPDEIKNAIFLTYQKLDEVVGFFRDKFVNEYNIVLMSDHGAGPYYKEIYLNNWLKTKGYLYYRDKEKKSLAKFIKSILKYLLFYFGRKTPHNWIMLIESLLPPQISRYLFSLGLNPIALDIDWGKTKVYSVGYFGCLYLTNGEDGITTERIIKDLENLRDPENGKLIIEKVYKKEQLFSGLFLSRIPDLIVKMKDDSYFIKPEHKVNKDVIFAATFKHAGLYADLEHTSNHRLYGVLIASGPQIKSGVEIKQAEIIDLFPTILRLLNLPIPDDIDGKVLDQFLKEEVVINKSVESQKEIATEDVVPATFSLAEEKTIEEHLRSLGYL